VIGWGEILELFTISNGERVVGVANSCSMLEKVSKCSMLMEKVSVAFFVLMIAFLPGIWRIHG
jgi:hypothetical protein